MNATIFQIKAFNFNIDWLNKFSLFVLFSDICQMRDFLNGKFVHSDQTMSLHSISAHLEKLLTDKKTSAEKKEEIRKQLALVSFRTELVVIKRNVSYFCTGYANMQSHLVCSNLHI